MSTKIKSSESAESAPKALAGTVPLWPGYNLERPPPQTFDAFLAQSGVYAPDAPELMELRERGFGDLKGRRVLFSAYESFYLTEKGRIRVHNKKSKEVLSLRELVERFAVGKPEIWIKYLVYRDLRDRGYIVRESPKVDFEVHGKGPMRRLISIVFEGGEASLSKLRKLLALSLKEKKDLILAVIDRRTDIVYYSLTTLGI